MAVLPVVFYHARIAGFAGGYAGVDVFFVISGFLITGILDREMRAGGFSVLRFYERRARRILPALFAVCFASALGVWLWFMPQDLTGFARSLIATMGFASNFLFWDESGYFARPSEWKPLLHTWSIGIEEQFYLAFPLFLLGARRVFGRVPKLLIAGCGLASFAVCVQLSATDPDTAFYLPHSRAWELLLGASLALGWIPPLRSQRWSELAGGIGLACLVWSFTTFSEATLFPGPYALVPCLGTALLIHANTGASTFTARLLSRRPLVRLGLVSYSLYLCTLGDRCVGSVCTSTSVETCASARDTCHDATCNSATGLCDVTTFMDGTGLRRRQFLHGRGPLHDGDLSAGRRGLHGHGQRLHRGAMRRDRGPMRGRSGARRVRLS